MPLELELKKLGFSDKEAKVYLSLLELGEGPVQKIAKKAGVNRATTYVVLDELLKQGMVSTIAKGKKTFFVAENPRMLFHFFGRQKEEIISREEEFKKAIPELDALYKSQDKKPKVRYFEGKEGMMAIQEDFLTSGVKSILAVYSADEFARILSQKESDAYIERRQGLGIAIRAIYTRADGPWENPTPGERRFVPKNKFPFVSDITIYGTKIAIATLRGKLMGVIIDSREMADTFTLMFELAWLGADSVQNS